MNTQLYSYIIRFRRKNGGLIKFSTPLGRNMPLQKGNIIVFNEECVGIDSIPKEVYGTAWKVKSIVHAPENHRGGGDTIAFVGPTKRPAGI